MPNKRNLDSVEKLKEKIQKAKSIIIVDYKGINVNDVNQLRAAVGEEGSEMNVSKNTLLKIALRDTGNQAKEIEDSLQGQSAAFFNYEDAISPIKKLYEFIKTHEAPTVRSGIVDGRVVGASEIEVLSNLPSKDQLRAQVVAGLKSPIYGIVNVLGGSQRKLVYALAAISEKKGV